MGMAALPKRHGSELAKSLASAKFSPVKKSPTRRTSDAVKILKRRYTDNVHHPKHYNQGEIEVIEFIEDQGHGKSFAVGNAMKYISRAGHKGDELEDLRKGIWYAMRRAEQVKAEREKRKPCRPNNMPKVPV